MLFSRKLFWGLLVFRCQWAPTGSQTPDRGRVLVESSHYQRRTCVLFQEPVCLGSPFGTVSVFYWGKKNLLVCKMRFNLIVIPGVLEKTVASEGPDSQPKLKASALGPRRRCGGDLQNEVSRDDMGQLKRGEHQVGLGTQMLPACCQLGLLCGHPPAVSWFPQVGKMSTSYEGSRCIVRFP